MKKAGLTSSCLSLMKRGCVGHSGALGRPHLAARALHNCGAAYVVKCNIQYAPAADTRGPCALRRRCAAQLQCARCESAERDTAIYKHNQHSRPRSLIFQGCGSIIAAVYVHRLGRIR